MLQFQVIDEIPAETRKVAEAAFPKGNLVMTIRDRLGTVYADEQFQDLFPSRGQPAESPARLALITVLQFMEGLTDRQAADAVRGRIDWKYCLGLELTNAGFHYSVLSEFRTRLLAGSAEERLLSILIRVSLLELIKGWWTRTD
jgi:transposase